MRQATNACLLVALSCASSAFVAPSTRGSAIHSCRRHSSSPLPRWRHTPVLCVDEGAAVADPPSAAPRFGRGDGGGGRGRGRGKSMELKNPMYLKRKAPVIPQGGGGRDQQRDAPRERTREFGPPASPSGSFKPSGPPSDDGDDGDGPSRDGPRRGSGAPVRRLNKKPEGRGGMSDSEGPRGKGAGKKSRQGAGDDFSRPMAMARAPRKKGKRGKANPVNAPPPPPVGPAQVTLGDTITVGELAQQLRVGAAEVVKDLMRMGVLASITQSIDADTAEKVALASGAEVTRGGSDEQQETSALGVVDEDDDEAKLEKRPPVVTIMGHVDHGKTSLLDAIRSANIVGGEAGGITQHIGAYSVPTPSGEETITFIDTPGHAAFDDMRSRGANITDIVILAIAADDGVMAQTKMSIAAAKAAGVPIIVAFTKSDKPEADHEKVGLELLQEEVVLEQYGGEVLSAQVSAKTGDGLGALFDQIALQADLLNLRANPERMASGTVLEARQVMGQGAVATVLVQRGTLKVGDIVVAGAQWGRVRALVSDAGDKLDAAAPSSAIEIVGLSGIPEAGDTLTVTEDDNKARELAATRQRLQREKRSATLFASTQGAAQQLFLTNINSGELPLKMLDFVVKADVQGSAEALTAALLELDAADDKLRVKTRVLRSGAGAVTNEDIMLAGVGVPSATIISFNAPLPTQQQNEATKAGVNILEYSVVYDAIDEVKAMMAALIRPPPNMQLGKLVGTLDVQQTFKIGAIGKVAGCRVLTGYIKVGCNIRILRGNLIVYEGKLQTLRSFKDIVEQVDAPNECGMSFDDYQGMEPEDRVEAYAANDMDDDDDDDDDDE